jgi:hypothetical protein
MTDYKEFCVSLMGGLSQITVIPEEFHPYEPSAYVTDPGWTCFQKGSETEYYVSVDGSVYQQPGNEFIGSVRELAERC